MTAPTPACRWTSHELDAGRRWGLGELPAGSVAAWWTVGWLVELADATTDTAWDAFDAWHDLRHDR